MVNIRVIVRSNSTQGFKHRYAKGHHTFSDIEKTTVKGIMRWARIEMFTKKYQSKKNILGIYHGGSRICTVCHAQVKSNDADFFQLFNAGIKTWDIEVTQLYKWKCREDQITG